MTTHAFFVVSIFQLIYSSGRHNDYLLNNVYAACSLVIINDQQITYLINDSLTIFLTFSISFIQYQNSSQLKRFDTDSSNIIILLGNHNNRLSYEFILSTGTVLVASNLYCITKCFVKVPNLILWKVLTLFCICCILNEQD